MTDGGEAGCVDFAVPQKYPMPRSMANNNFLPGETSAVLVEKIRKMSRRCAHLTQALKALEAVAPSRIAAKWDNTGLLIDATRHFDASRAARPYRVFFTNDLTPAVLDEAVSAGSNLIVTYHPTPFVALKKFSSEVPAANVVLTAAANGIAVYSPHTALDVVPGGINEWLVNGVAGALPGGPVGVSMRPVKPSDDPAAAASGIGDGRIGTFAPASGVTLAAVIAAVKSHLRLPTVAVALPSSLLSTVAAGRDAVATAAAAIPVDSFAVCAGSGAGVLAGCRASVWITGELSHHEVCTMRLTSFCFHLALAFVWHVGKRQAA